MPGSEAQLSDESQDWKPPPEFEIVKELNAHAGRIATSLAFLLAAGSISIANGAIRDILSRPAGTLQPVSVSLALSGMSLIAGIMFLAFAFEPAVPLNLKDISAWCRLLERKRRYSEIALGAVVSSVFGLLAAWAGAYIETFGLMASIAYVAFALVGSLNIFRTLWLF